MREDSRKSYKRGMVWMALFLVGLAFCMFPSRKELEMQREIAEQILRFHVLANSDSTEDQQIKMKVKERVVEYLEPLLGKSCSKEETIALLEQELPQIVALAQKVSPNQKVIASVHWDWFPQIQYGDCTFPEGEYETLCIQLGAGEGHNWWCVLYPGLCFSHAVRPVITQEGKDKLHLLLDQDCYDFLMHPAETKLRFRWLGLEFFGWNS